ncbi:hypothetical protein, partial [Pseudomonas tolaasii]|uniref:hypothetical protein n=1 Tax=Pseudomonas tolaasii TaxID=29442 RepID=UPI001C42ED4F
MANANLHILCILLATVGAFLFDDFHWQFTNCEPPTSHVNLAAIAKSQGQAPHLCPTPFNEFAYDPMSKATSDLSSHTPMMQQ